MKLGVTYSLYNGYELLPFSVKAIRPAVDYINVVYQDYSWFGKPADPEMYEIVNKLKGEGLVDNVLKYDIPPSDDYKDTKGNAGKATYKKNIARTLEKRNLGIEDLKKNDCDYCMILDVDEFYRAEDIEKATKFIEKNGITVSCVSSYPYAIKPTYRSKTKQEFSFQFIMKLEKDAKCVFCDTFPCLVDPIRSLGYDRKKDKFYYFTDFTLHHMSLVRKDFSEKISSTIENSLKNATDFTGGLERKFESAKNQAAAGVPQGYIEVPNEFGIEL